MSRSPLTETVNRIGFAAEPKPASAVAATSSVARRAARSIELARVTRTKQLIVSLTALVGGLLLAAPAAIAADGVGLWGRTDDKVITYASFAVMGFFVILVVALTLVQQRLENRKERARDELERLRGP